MAKAVKLQGKEISNFNYDLYSDAIATISNVKVSFVEDLEKKNKLVIRDTGFQLRQGEILGIIGESGSGKSVITSLLSGLTGRNSIIESGKINVLGYEVQNWTPKQWNKSKLRGKEIGRVFQNPMSALNPTIKIRYQLIETLMDFKICTKEKEAIAITAQILKDMNIQDPEFVMDLYPHELSGGMIQRIVITMVIATRPKIIIFDEPTTALDPIVQADILEIIKNLNKKYKISMIFITHDIGVISTIADRIAVMYAGRIIETGKRNQILFNPAHPYTWGLLSSLPTFINEKDSGIKGMLDIKSLKEDQDAFVFRNKYALDIDLEARPPTFWVEKDHYVESWLYHPKAPKVVIPQSIASLNERYK